MRRCGDLCVWGGLYIYVFVCEVLDAFFNQEEKDGGSDYKMHQDLIHNERGGRD